MKCENDLEWLEAYFSKQGYECLLADGRLSARHPLAAGAVVTFYRNSSPWFSGSRLRVAEAMSLLDEAEASYEHPLPPMRVILPDEGPWAELEALGVVREKIEGGWLAAPPSGWRWGVVSVSVSQARYRLLDSADVPRALVVVGKSSCGKALVFDVSFRFVW